MKEIIDKDEKRDESELKFIAGSIRKDRVVAFERVLWRMTHGNVYIRTIDIEPEPNAPFVSLSSTNAYARRFIS